MLLRIVILKVFLLFIGFQNWVLGVCFTSGLRNGLAVCDVWSSGATGLPATLNKSAFSV